MALVIILRKELQVLFVSFRKILCIRITRLLVGGLLKWKVPFANEAIQHNAVPADGLLLTVKMELKF